MKKLFTLFLLLVFFCLSYANPVSELTAKTAAEYFIKNGTRSMLFKAVSNPDLKLVYRAILKGSNTKESRACFYVFNVNAAQGFVIVSGDDNATPILGYSDEKNFDPAKIPPSVVKWLEGYKSQLRYIIQNKTSAGAELKKKWDNLIAPTAVPPALNTVIVAPIMQTTWDQSPYYNASCPFDNQHNERTVTGCVATAMAQIMKRWNYPATGAGFHSYNTQNYGTLSANYGSTTYEWAAMPNSVTSANNAVATLMSQVGISVDMNYGVAATGGSGAYVITDASPVVNCAEYALETYFGYDNTLHGVQKVNYTDLQWINLLKTDLNAGRPVLYAGFGGGGGHCFVTDGYDDNNMFHFNWGWSGNYDGYFAIDALNPGGVGTGGGTGGFNSGHQAVLGIKPTNGGGGGSQKEDIRLYSDIVISTVGGATTSIYYGEEFDVDVSIVNYSASIFTGSYCAAIFDDGNNFIDYVDTLPTSSLNSNFFLPITFTCAGLFSMLPGNYKIGIFYKPVGGNWIQASNYLTYINLKPVTVINPNDIELNKSITVAPDTLLTEGSPASFNINIVNDGETTFTGQYLAGLFKLDGTHVQTIGTINEDDGLEPHYTYLAPYLTFSTNAITAEPGTYLLAIEHKLTDGDWQLTGSSYFQNPIKVTVQAASIQPDKFEVNNTAALAYALPVNFTGNTATVNTTGSSCHLGSDYDYYKIELPAGYNYTIDARIHDSYNSGNGIIYTLDALFSDSTSLPGSTWSDAFDDLMPGTIQVNGGTTVYFKVSPYFTGEIGTYLLDMTVTRSAVAIYTFTGNGNWDNAANWAGNNIPPTPLPAGTEIIINPQAGGECILNVPQTILAGAKLTVAPNAKLKIAGALIQQ